MTPSAWRKLQTRIRGRLRTCGFETSKQAIHRAVKRLQKLGVAQLPRDARVVELFCGRGNGLHALASLGFTRFFAAADRALRRPRQMLRIRLPPASFSRS